MKPKPSAVQEMHSHLILIKPPSSQVRKAFANFDLGNLERKFMQAQLKPAPRIAVKQKPSGKEYSAMVPTVNDGPAVFKVKPTCIKRVSLKTSYSTSSLNVKPTLKNMSHVNGGSNMTPCQLKTISASSIDLRTTPGPRLSGIPSRPINIREAIRTNDHLRIRNGSPGSSTNEGKTADRFKTLDQTTAGRSNFDEEMQEKGLMSEIKDLSRFNYVLVTRTSPSDID